MTGSRRGWVEASKRQPCLRCGKDHHCTRTADGLVTKCMYVEPDARAGGRRIKQSDGSCAWLYRTADLGAVPERTSPKRLAPRMGKAELRNLIRQHQADVTPDRLRRWSAALGVTVRALQAFGAGYDVTSGCASFPMYDGTFDSKGRPTPCGIRLRHPDSGQKRAVVGSRNGLFVPAGYESKACPVTTNPEPLLLLMPEGPTDCCAAFDLGFRAVGRPSNSGGVDQVRSLLDFGDRQDVVIFADRDEPKWAPDGMPFLPGWEGALGVAREILPKCGTLKVIVPPKGTKDLRQWLREGGTTGLIVKLYRDAELVTRDWLTAKRHKLYEWKQRNRRRAG